MKKIYQAPTVNIVAVRLQHMIAESIAIGNAYSGGSIQSRRGGFWDEDEEDDEEWY